MCRRKLRPTGKRTVWLKLTVWPCCAGRWCGRDTHKPRGDGPRYVSGAGVLQKTDSSATKRGGTRNATGLGDCTGGGRASPADGADETPTSPGGMGLGTYQERECSRRRIHPLLSGEARGTQMAWGIALGEAVLRRPMVRARTSTTPGGMGLGTYQGRKCLEKQSFPLLSGEASMVGAGAKLGAVITRW